MRQAQIFNLESTRFDQNNESPTIKIFNTQPLIQSPEEDWNIQNIDHTKIYIYRIEILKKG